MPVENAIDAHVHLWTSDLKHYALAAGYERSQINPGSFTADEFLHVAGCHGITRAVLVQMDFYGTDNSYMLDTIQKFPNRFSGVVQISDQCDLDAEFNTLKSRGVRGIRITSSSRGGPHSLDSPRLDAIWAYGAANKIAICLLMNAEDVPAVNRMCRRHPQSCVVIDHCARIQSDTPTTEAGIEALCGLALHPHTYVKLSALYFLMQLPAQYKEIATVLRRLLHSFGVERLMWGSDSPFQLLPPHTYSDSFLAIAERLDFLDSRAKQWLLRDTAAKVFFS